MKEQLQRIFELPLQYRIGILLGSIVFIVGLYWLYFLAPVQEEIEKSQKAIDGPEGLRAKIAQQEAMARSLPRFEKEVERLNIELKKALQELPDKKEISLLLSRISDKASDAGLEIRLFKPQDEQKKEFYAEVPVEIEVTGTFHQVATFFDEVGRLERIVNLDNLSVSDPDVTDDRVTVKTGVIATAFRFLEESERIQPEEKADKRRRRRGRR